jgi:hypothetical protein
LSETGAQLVVAEKKVKRDRRIDSQQPRKHRKSKSFLSRIFLPRSAAAAISANNQLLTAKIRKQRFANARRASWPGIRRAAPSSRTTSRPSKSFSPPPL